MSVSSQYPSSPLPCLQQFQNDIQGLINMLHQIKKNEDPNLKESSMVITQEQIASIADLVSDRTTKFQVAFQGVPLDTCNSFTEMLQQELVNLVSLTAHILVNETYCQTLHLQVRRTTFTILNSVSDLVTGIQSQLQSTKLSQKSAPLTGIVWEACKEFKVIELDNFLSVKQELLKWSLPLIQDAIKELEELKSSPSKDIEGEDDKVEMDEEDDEWNDMEDEQLTEEDKLVLTPCVTLMKCSYSLIKKIGDLMPFTEPQEEIGVNGIIAWLDDLIEVCKKDIEGVDQLGTSVYPPQDSLLSSASSLGVIQHSLIQYIKSMIEKSDQKEPTSKFLTLLEKKQNDAIRDLDLIAAKKNPNK